MSNDQELELATMRSLAQFAKQFIDTKCKLVAIIFGLFNGIQVFACRDTGLRDAIRRGPTVITVLPQKKESGEG
jgi:hypothetical protein